MQEDLGEFREHKWDKGRGTDNFFPSSFLTVWENPDSDKSQAIDYFHSPAFVVIVTFHALRKERKKLLLLTRSPITALKLQLIFMNAVSFHFNT